MDDKRLIFHLRSSFRLRYISFCPNFYGQVGKRLDKKAKVNFKIREVTTWKTNNCNTHIATISRSEGS